jgi:hypothetical protein
MTWTRDHERLVHAWAQLSAFQLRHGWNATDLNSWIERKFDRIKYAPGRLNSAILALTPSQLRQARRCLNAYRAGMEGRAEARPHPRQWARNARRSGRTAATTASMRARIPAWALSGKGNSAAGRLVKTIIRGNRRD